MTGYSFVEIYDGWRFARRRRTGLEPRPFLAVAVVIAALWATTALGADKDKKEPWGPIPAPGGIRFFLGEWTGNHPQAGNLTIEPGVIKTTMYRAADNWRTVARVIVAEYMVLKEADNHVVLATKTHYEFDGSVRVDVEFFRLRSGWVLINGYCSSRRPIPTADGPSRDFTVADYDKGRAHMLRLWQTSDECGPDTLGYDLAYEHGHWSINGSYWSPDEDKYRHLMD